MTGFISDPHKSEAHMQLFYKELLIAGLTPEEIAAGPERLSAERVAELQLAMKPGSAP